MKQFIILFIFCTSSFFAFGQNTYQDYWNDANKAFNNGDYDKAIKDYRSCIELGGSNSAEFITKAEKCKTLFSNANVLFDAGNYSEAKAKYQELQKLNPSDRNAQKRIEECNNRLKPTHGEQPPSQTATPQSNKLKPTTKGDPPLKPERLTPNYPKIIAGFGNGVVAGKGMGIYGTLRFGEPKKDINTFGFGITGGFGLVNLTESDDYRFPWSNAIHEKLYHWSIGTMGLYNIKDKTSLFVSGHYSAVTTTDKFSTGDNGSFSLQNDKILYGISVLGGFEKTFGNWVREWLHFTAGIGGSYTLDDNPKFMLAWNVGIGIFINGSKK